MNGQQEACPTTSLRGDSGRAADRPPGLLFRTGRRLRIIRRAKRFLEPLAPKPEVPKVGEGTGMGRKTVELICSEMGIPLDHALAGLRQKGIQVKTNDTLKEIASKVGKTPMDIYNIMEGKE